MDDDEPGGAGRDGPGGSDPVGGRRGRRLAAVAVVAVVLLAVVLVRGTTAVDDGELAALRPDARPSAEVEPSPTGPPVALLTANGLPGMRLGAEPGDGMEELGLEDHLGHEAGGCDVAYPTYLSVDHDAGEIDDTGFDDYTAVRRLTETVSVEGLLHDGRLVSLFLQSFDAPDRTVDGLRTWLGVTLGSPVEAAAELPGAVTTRERPFADGPTVTVVRVPLRGGGTELVMGDAATGVWPVAGEAPTEGRITSIEVRSPAARGCRDVLASARESSDGPVSALDVDGAAGALLGADADPLIAEGRLEAAEEWGGGPDCSWYETVDGQLRVSVGDGTVVRVEPVEPRFSSDLGVRSGTSAQALLDGPLGPHLTTGLRSERGTVTVQDLRTAGEVVAHLPDGRRLEMYLWPESRLVPVLETYVMGGEPSVQQATLVQEVDGQPVYC